MLTLHALTTGYRHTIISRNLNATLPQGTLTALLGTNGAGKSTVIECVLGTKRMDGGQVSILGMNPLAHRKKLFEKVGVQFQESNYQDQITVAELCKVTASLYQRPADPNELLKRFGIAGKQKNLVRELSGGRYELKEATLYTAFQRLEETGQIMSYWGSEATGARRRYYRITPAGRMAYQEQVGVWEATKEIIDRLIAMEEES